MKKNLKLLISKNLSLDNQESILNKKTVGEMLVLGLAMTGVALFLFNNYRENMAYASTVAFTSLVFLQLFNSLNVRSGRSILKTNFFSNPKLLIAIVFSALLQLVVIYSPVRVFLKAEPLALKDLGLIIASAILIIFVSELWKLLVRLKAKKTI